ncbi:MAG: thrombospondin type 3 repeat-containing protein [bacterium]
MDSRVPLATLFVAAAGVAVVLLVLPHHASAENYWGIGLPTYEVDGQPTTVISTTYHGTGLLGSGIGTVQYLKAGLVPVGGGPVPFATTNQYSFGDAYDFTQLSNKATYLVTTSDNDFSVMQTTAVYGVSATTDATRLLPESKLGKDYVVATAANSIAYLNPNPAYFTVVAIKDSTTVTVMVSVPTAGTVASGVTVPPMVPGTPYGYTVNRGWALHVTAKDGDITCVIAVLACPPADLTGSSIKCSTSCAVYAGSNCLSLEDGSCDTINEQMLPNAVTGKVYVMCSAQQSGTGQLDWLKIRAVNGPTTIMFARPAIGGTTTATVTPGTYSLFRFNTDTVVTASDQIHVVQYLARSDVPPHQTGASNPIGSLAQVYNANTAYGDPSYVEISAIDRSTSGHWMYADPTWETTIYVGAPGGTPITIATDGGAPIPFPAVERPIGSSGYSCFTKFIPSQAGATYLIAAPPGIPITSQMLGLGFYTSYFYDAFGGTPLVVPPPLPPGASFKWTDPSLVCGAHPIHFIDGSLKGTGAINSWAWEFGDGTTSDEQSPTHTYPGAGDYSVTLTITDDNGFVSKQTQIVTATVGDACLLPTISQDNGHAPRPPHDGVDPAVAGADIDGDGILNAQDNCVFVANGSQDDLDLDAVGDACDTDMDNDRILNARDNCPETSNGDQPDMNADGEGDACDSDIDGDNVPNAADNCATVANVDQLDANGNQVGDVCDGKDLAAAGGPGASAPLESTDAGLAAPAQGGNGLLAVMLAAGAAALVLAVVVTVVMVRRSR